VLTLTVNGTQVAQHTLTEPANQRIFGLFRYADKTKCRVRNIVYRGDWPKELPPVENQELAYSTRGALSTDKDQWPSTMKFALHRPLSELEQIGFHTLGSADTLNTIDSGIRIELRSATDPNAWPGLVLKHPIIGDCDATLDFEQLQLTPAESGWGCGFTFKLLFDSPHNVWTEAGVFMDSQGKQKLQAAAAHNLTSGAEQKDVRHFSGQPGQFASGRLRMVRLGGYVHCLYAAKESDYFRLLESFPVGDAPISEFRVQNVASDEKAGVDVVVNHLTLRH
jgi:hypothetical protein